MIEHSEIKGDLQAIQGTKGRKDREERLVKAEARLR